MIILFQQPILNLLRKKTLQPILIQNDSDYVDEPDIKEEIKQFGEKFVLEEANLKYDHFYSILNWVVFETDKNTPITAWFINYSKNLFLKNDISTETLTNFLFMQENGTYKELKDMLEVDYNFVIIPWLITTITFRIKNKLSSYSLDFVSFHFEEIISNLLSNENRIKTEIISNYDELKIDFTKLENLFFSFKIELADQFKKGNFLKIVENKESYLAHISSLRYVIESYISLRNYEEVENLIDNATKTFNGKNENGIILFLKGKAIFTKGLINDAIKILQIAELEFDKLQNYWRKKVKVVLGWCLFSQGNVEEAKNTFLSVLDFFEDQNDDYECNLIYSGLSIIYERFQDFENSINYGSKVLKIYKQWGNKKLIFTSSNNLAVVYENYGDLDKALELYHECLTIQTELNNPEGIALIKNNLGNIYRLKGDLDKGNNLLHEALDIRLSLQNPKDTAASLYKIMLIDQIQGKLTDVRVNLEKILELYEKTGEEYNKLNSIIYISLVLHLSGDSSKAYNLLSDSINKSIKTKDFETILRNFNFLLKIGYFLNKPLDKELEKLFYTNYNSLLTKSPLIESLIALINARIIINSGKFEDSEKILTNLIKSKKLTLDIKLDCYDALLGLFCEELKRNYSKDKLKLIEHHLENISEIATQKGLVILHCESYILRGKLFLTNFNFSKAQSFFEKAELIAQNNTLILYLDLLEKEMKNLDTLKKKFEKINSFIEKSQKDQINDLIHSIKSFFIAF